MFRKACLTGATSFREPEHLEGANSLDLWAPPAKSFLLHILSEFLIWTFYNLTFNLYFHFCFLKTQVTKTRYIFSHCRRTKGRLFILLILWSIQDGEAGSAAGEFFLVRILIEFSVLAAQQNIQTTHYPLLQQRGLVRGHLITKLQLWRPAKTI